jgi:hypothetical protein
MAEPTNQSEYLQRALDEAGSVVEAARKNLAQLEKSLAALGKREKQLAAKLASLRKKRKSSGNPAKTSAETTTELALRAARHMVRRNRGLLSQQKKSCRDKERALDNLRKHADNFRDKKATPIEFQGIDSTAAGFGGGESIHGSQLAGARAILSMSVGDFAALLGLSAAQIRTAEKTATELDLSAETTREVLSRLWDMGLEFIQPGIYVGNGGHGIRMRKEPSGVAKAAGKPPRVRKASRRKKKVRKVKAA